MGQAVHPVGYRLGFNRKWNNLSFQSLNNNSLLQDFEMINYLEGAFLFNKFIIDTPYILKEGNEINVFFSLLNVGEHISHFKTVDIHRPIDLAHMAKLYKHLPLAKFKKNDQILYSNVYKKFKPVESSILLANKMVGLYHSVLINSNCVDKVTLAQYFFWLKVSHILSLYKLYQYGHSDPNFYLSYKNLLKKKIPFSFNKFYRLKLFHKKKPLKFISVKRVRKINSLLKFHQNNVLTSRQRTYYSLLSELKHKLQNKLTFYSSSKVNLYFKECDTFMAIPFTNATILAKLIAYYKRYNQRNYVKFLNYIFKMAAKLKPVAGLQVLVTGRTRSSSRSKQYVYKYGRIPTQALKAKIDYYYTKTVSRSGISGIKVWVYGSK